MYFLIQSPEDISFLEKNIQNLSLRKSLIIVLCNYKYPLNDFLKNHSKYPSSYLGYKDQFWAHLHN